MWSRRGLLAAGGVLCWSLGSGLDSSALVQSGVALHGQFGREDRTRAADLNLGQGDELIEEPEEYIVDNSQLQHRGPGVLYRRSKSLSDPASRDQYATWGSTVSGTSSGDGWVKVGQQYLPVEVKGATVLVRKGPPKPKRKLHTSFQPTQIRSPDGGWIPANITGPGSKPHTWNVVVMPRTLANYPVDDVPEAALQMVSSVRELVKVKPTRTHTSTATSAGRSAAPAAGAAEESGEEEEEDELLSVTVEDFVGKPMEIKLSTSLPVQTLMIMACDKVSMPRETCTKDVQFIHHGRPLKEHATFDAMELKSGDTIYMLRKQAPPKRS